MSCNATTYYIVCFQNETFKVLRDTKTKSSVTYLDKLFSLNTFYNIRHTKKTQRN